MKVLKFGAAWCPGCITMKPRWKEIEEENPWLHTEYFDFDSERHMAKSYDVTEVLPTFVFLDKEGKEFLRLHGEVPKEELMKILEENKEK